MDTDDTIMNQDDFIDREMHGAREFPTTRLSYLAPPSHVAAAATQAAASGSVSLQIKRLTPSATIPTRGSAFAAGYDLYASENATVPARGQAMVATGIAIAVPPETYGRVAPRSGLAAKHGIATGAGVIDYDYRGEVKVILFNHTDFDFAIRPSDRIAQLVLERIITPDVVEVAQLEETIRGIGGFGSTGGFGTQMAMEAVNGHADSLH